MTEKRYKTRYYAAALAIVISMMLQLGGCRGSIQLDAAKPYPVIFGTKDESGACTAAEYVTATVASVPIRTGDTVPPGTTVAFSVAEDPLYRLRHWEMTIGKQKMLEVYAKKTVITVAVTDEISVIAVMEKKQPEVSDPLPQIPQLPPASGSTEPALPGSFKDEYKPIIFRHLMESALTLKKASSADLSQFGINCSSDPLSQHKLIYNEFIKKYPFIFHLSEDGRITYQYTNADEYKLQAYIVEPRIHVNFEEYFKKVEKSLEEFYGLLREGMTDAEIAYTLHNAVAAKAEYADVPHAADTFGVLTEGKAICQGYSLAYRRLLLGMGINAECVYGPTRTDVSGHMWSAIQLDGNWYNLDVTWDDEPDAQERARSFSKGMYFLTSDSMFYDALQHPRDEKSAGAQPALSKKYDTDKPIFRNGQLKTEPVYHNKYWYYISYKDNSIYRSRFDGSEVQQIYRFKYPALTGKKFRNYLYNRLEVGQNGLYFIDSNPDNPKKDVIYRINYTDLTVTKHNPITFDEAVQHISLVSSDDTVTVQKGIVALRAELMLAKMKDAYYHGSEDYFRPVSAERQAFWETIAQAEALIQQPQPSDDQAEHLYKRLHDMRKSYSLGWIGGV